MCGLSVDSVMVPVGRAVLLWSAVVFALCRQGDSLKSPIFDGMTALVQLLDPVSLRLTGTKTTACQKGRVCECAARYSQYGGLPARI
ncbi:hypothetical protein LSAT2_014561 [Lamellibrachia satsuma]|nr:hypothetical protein LSAT2_014561 [Lamellibrachia satsuma]